MNFSPRQTDNKSSIRSKLFTACALTILLALPILPAPFLSHPTNAETPEAEAVSSNAVSPGRTHFVLPTQQEAPGKPHLLASSYYNVNENFDATLTLNNKGPQPLEVQLTLFNLAGERLDILPVTVEANSHRVVNLRDYALAGTTFQEGSLQVVYHGKDLEMGAQVKIVDAARGLIFDEQLVEPAMMFASSRLEGVWWMPSRACDVRLVLSNTTAELLTVTANVDGHAPKAKEPMTLALLPHETRIVDMNREGAGAKGGPAGLVGGISVEHSGPKGALIGRVLIQATATGYSAVAELVDPQKAKSSELHGTGLRLGSVAGEELTPIIVARNTGDAATILTGRIPYSMKDGSASAVSLPEIRLAPGETKLVNLPNGLRRSGIAENVASAGLEFEYASEPGSVVMSALSIGKSGGQVFRVPLINPAAMPSSTGGYPWYIEGDSSTVAYVKNVTDEPHQYTLQLTFLGGVYSLGLKTIEAGQTMALDIRDLRDNGVPDARGRTIPPDAARGQVMWSWSQQEEDEAALGLIGRAEQADITRGLSSSYACVNCCPNSFAEGWVTPTPITGFVGDATDCDAMQQDENCYGTLLTPYSRSAAWTSNNLSVATIDGGGWASAVGVGSAYLRASWNTYVYSGAGGYCDSTRITPFAEAFCEVLAAEVRYTRVTAKTRTSSETSANFTHGIGTDTADLNYPDCPGNDRVSVIVSFSLPENAASLSASRSTVRLEPNSKYNLISVNAPEMYDNRASGFIEFVLQRKTDNSGSSNKVRVKIEGSYYNGDALGGNGTVNMICAY